MLPSLPMRKQAHRKEIACRSLRGQWGIETFPRVDKKSRVNFPAVKSIPGFEGFFLIKLSGPTEENRGKLLNMEGGEEPHAVHGHRFFVALCCLWTPGDTNP